MILKFTIPKPYLLFDSVVIFEMLSWLKNISFNKDWHYIDKSSQVELITPVEYAPDELEYHATCN